MIHLQLYTIFEEWKLWCKLKLLFKMMLLKKKDNFVPIKQSYISNKNTDILIIRKYLMLVWKEQTLLNGLIKWGVKEEWINIICLFICEYRIISSKKDFQ